MKFIVRMRGGLGNQMFQYAYTLALRERYPEAEIVLDTREYGTYTRRSFALTDFVLAKNTSLFSQGRLAYDVPIRLYHVWQRLYREVRHEHPFGVNDSLARRGFLLTGLGCPLPRGGLPETTGTFRTPMCFFRFGILCERLSRCRTLRSPGFLRLSLTPETTQLQSVFVSAEIYCKAAGICVPKNTIVPGSRRFGGQMP